MAGRKITPAYRLHTKTGKAIVTVYDADGSRRSFLLPGKFESKESKTEYKRLLARLAANDDALPKTEVKKPEILISELILRYMKEHVIPYYVDPVTRKPTGEQENFRCAFRPLNRMFGQLPAVEFGPLALIAVQNKMIDGSWMNDEEKSEREKIARPLGLARGTINTRIGRIKMMFSWATRMQLIPASISHGLREVRGLAAGRSKARETEATRPVAIGVVEETMAHLPPITRDIVHLLLLTGARVGEIVGMRACDLDTTGKVWIFTPQKFKTKWRGHKRLISTGPRAQAIIRKYLGMKIDDCLFKPSVQEAMIRADKRAMRKTKVQPSQVSRRKAKPKKKPGEQFTPGDINQAIRRTCKRIGIPTWHTHQLRHTAAREIIRQHGLDSARAVLGHKTLQMTADYGGHDTDTASEVMLKIG